MSGRSTSKEPYIERFVLSNAREDIDRAQQSILGAVECRVANASCCFGIRLALEEALSNAFKHGNGDDPAKTVRLTCRIADDRIVLEVEDEGQGFDPSSVPDPTQEENVEIPAGRGLVLMRSFMSDVTIHPPGNRVEMTYELDH